MYRKNGAVDSVEAEPMLDDKDYKKTQKITWLAETSQAEFTPATCVHFDNLITKGVIGKDEDFKDFINTDSKVFKHFGSLRFIILIWFNILLK